MTIAYAAVYYAGSFAVAMHVVRQPGDVSAVCFGGKQLP